MAREVISMPDNYLWIEKRSGRAIGLEISHRRSELPKDFWGFRTSGEV
jgi:hypothetical protein